MRRFLLRLAVDTAIVHSRQPMIAPERHVRVQADLRFAKTEEAHRESVGQPSQIRARLGLRAQGPEHPSLLARPAREEQSRRSWDVLGLFANVGQPSLVDPPNRT